MNDPHQGPDVPVGVGPHECRELQLMLVGTKPLAVFFDVIPPTFQLPEEEFEPALNSGRIILRQEIYQRPETNELPLRYLFYSLVEERHRIETLHRINKELIEEGHQAQPKHHKLIGQLLGYEPWEIEAFLKCISGQPANS